ncbi:MAG: hypothetical protein P8Z79_12845 [Sedimentisphaerales bacterium]
MYDLKVDPYEFSNIAGKPEAKPILEKMRGQLKAWMVSQNDPAL